MAEHLARVLRIAARVLDAPIAMVSRIDHEQEYFVATIGSLPPVVPLAGGLAGGLLVAGGALLVEDASTDPRFGAGPLVAGDPRLRFYAGALLRAVDGSPAGVLAVADTQPRIDDGTTVELLGDLADWAEVELDASPTPVTAGGPSGATTAMEHARADFVTAMAHEMRTPLTAIIGYAEMVTVGATSSPEQLADDLRVIRSNAIRLNQLVDDLLEVARAEAGELRLELGPVQLAEVVRDVARNLEPEYRARDIPLELELASDLPTINGDRRRLEQVFSNLLSNAQKYTLDGGSVRVHSEVSREAVCLHVTDTGVGLNEEDQVRVFRKFFRARNPATREVAGTGLGLAITRSLVRQHGGEVEIHSHPGAGTTFTVRLPRATSSS